MSKRTCSVCTLDHYARGLCKGHYKRVVEGKGLQPEKPLRVLPTAAQRGDIEGRILAECVVRPSGCIEWVRPGGLNHAGYGTVSWNGKRWLAHRAMWTVKRGPLPPAPMTIDHLCSNRACVNVDHMEIVTLVENVTRGGGLDVANERRRAREAERTHCRHGHDRAEYEHTVPSGASYCRKCRAIRHQQRKSVA